jgi:hypothetical protein
MKKTQSTAPAALSGKQKLSASGPFQMRADLGDFFLGQLGLLPIEVTFQSISRDNVHIEISRGPLYPPIPDENNHGPHADVTT